MKTLNFSAIVFLILLLSMAPLSGCGSSGGSSSSGDQAGDGSGDTGDQPDDDTSDDSDDDSGSVAVHSVPEWMIGSWLVVRLRLGADVSSRNMILTVTETEFEYHYPGCDVYGSIEMDESTPYYASNEYTLLMTFVDCPVQWDIPSFDGAIDEGHIWADNEGDRFFRISDLYAQFTWVYIRQ